MSKVYIGFAILVSLFIGGGAIYLRGHYAGAKAEVAKVEAKQAKTVAKHAKATGYVKSHMDSLQAMPDPAPTGSVALAPAGTPSRELQDNWTRD